MLVVEVLQPGHCALTSFCEAIREAVEDRIRRHVLDHRVALAAGIGDEVVGDDLAHQRVLGVGVRLTDDRGRHRDRIDRVEDPLRARALRHRDLRRGQREARLDEVLRMLGQRGRLRRGERPRVGGVVADQRVVPVRVIWPASPSPAGRARSRGCSSPASRSSCRRRRRLERGRDVDLRRQRSCTARAPPPRRWSTRNLTPPTTPSSSRSSPKGWTSWTSWRNSTSRRPRARARARACR